MTRSQSAPRSLQVNAGSIRFSTISGHICTWPRIYATPIFKVSTRQIKTRNAKLEAQLKPAIVALNKTANTLDYYLDKRLFDLPLAARLELRSHEQSAWINVVVTPTVRQAKAKRGDIRNFLIRPAQNIAPHPLWSRSTNSNPFLASGMGSHRCHCSMPLHCSHLPLHYFKHLYLLTSSGHIIKIC
jgi:hypothetical protein